MGNRANIKIVTGKANDIYFYSHWGGYDLPLVLKRALIRGENRWDDDAYLNRIIFSEMIKGNVLEETGFGISLELCDNQNFIINVNPTDNTVDFNSHYWSFQEYISMSDEDILSYYHNGDENYEDD